MIHGEVVNQPTSPSEQLASRLRGKVYQPNCDEYHRSRTVWNGGIDRNAALIAHCAGVSDIRARPDYAHAQNLCSP